MTAKAAMRLAIRGCGAVTPAGPGLGSLGELLAEGSLSHAVPPAGEESQFPPLPVHTVPELRLADYLGSRKGLRHIDRMTSFGLVATRLALDDMLPFTEAEQSRTGIALGTSTGSTRSSTAVARDTITQQRPYLVNPSEFPNTVMNSCAAQMAIWNSLRGVNSTVAAGQLSSLYALRYARMAISQGQADRLLAGGVEELNPQSAWAWYVSNALARNAAIGEACVLFLVEKAADSPGGQAPLGEILACEAGYSPPTGQRRGLRADLTGCLASSIARALASSGARPEEIDLVSVGAATGSGLASVEEQAIAQALGRVPPEIRVSRSVGDCYSASTALQIAALLALWQREPPTEPRVGLVTSVSRDRHAGCLIVRSAP
jgi:3-oxoacyl-[acyl-carrier-protein] synthase II